MGRYSRSSSRRSGLNDVQKMFSACLAPIPNCSSMGSFSDQRKSSKKSRSRSRSKQRDAIWKMGEGLKKQISKAMLRADDASILSRDEDATLINELQMRRANSTQTETDASESDESRNYSDTWGSGSDTNLNTIGDDTLDNMRGKRNTAVPGTPISKDVLAKNSSLENAESVASGLKHLPGAYKKSVRGKFDYYRKNQTFGKVETPLPLNLQTFLAHEAKKGNISQPSPATRRNNELAKQILKRRQNHPQTPSRSGADP